jgi:molecular chaperone GrpE
VRRHRNQDEIEEDDQAQQPRDEDAGRVEARPDAGAVVETAESRIARLEEEVADLKDRYLRALADIDNIRKRSRRDQEEAIRYGITSVIGELLPVLDNFERALKAAQEAGEKGPLVEGVAMVRRQFLALLEKRGITPLEAVGKMFDPAYHDAVARMETDDRPEGQVVEEVERGYAMGDVVLRPSKVVVAVGPSSEDQ